MTPGVAATSKRPARRAPGALRQWQHARRYLAHGVNSPVRSFAAVDGVPVFAARGQGAYVWDITGRRYLEYIGGWGPQILGHAPLAVRKAIAKQLARGTTFGLPTELETDLGRRICAAFPSIERVRFTCSGTEACMSAIRLARAATKRTKILKFAGCYHGHADAFLVTAGSGLATFAGGGTSSSAGVPEAVAAETLVVEYNDLAAAHAVFARHGQDIAAVIVEPWAANMGFVLPQPGFLAGLRQLTQQSGSLLIFDEVITGFRVAYGGVQHLERLWPDVTILGKIIGGGLPIGAFGGRKTLMDLLAPAGPVYQAGTLAGHPLAMTAGIATLDTLQRQQPSASLAHHTATLATGLQKAAQAHGVAVQVNARASLLTCFFTSVPVTNFTSAQRADARQYARFFRRMQEQGVLLPPSQFEAWLLSAAHGPREIRATLRAARSAFAP